MGIEFIVLFSMFIVYIAVTELRVYFIDKNHRKREDVLLKSVLEEADVRAEKELKEKEIEEYYDLQRVAMMGQDTPELKEKTIYAVPEMESEFNGSYGNAIDEINQKIRDYNDRE